jgi:hypothetical protein
MTKGAELRLSERETCLNMTADDRSVWEVFSDDPVMQRKLEAIGATLLYTVGQGSYYSIPAACVTLRKPSTMSPEERARRGARLRETLSSAQTADGIGEINGKVTLVVQG